ncbi:hypothetical protein [Streptomyces sp. UNOB3_S3]|uniref:hypothetical protein n=1 Tax=Streptomyces sp. UNOB3_S3 TaxID=2871682 RepID=UPI001E45858D|nr:hypothetical protein [Streptomyces sp. UNOB3_S3]MCC3776598.1 hypothetical protein [Streptomyces sp. UNOB3_S3]
MIGLPRRKHKESRDAEHERRLKDKAAKAGKESPKPEEGVYKPAPEEDILGWGHRGQNPPE